MTSNELITFFGCSAIINIIILLFTTFMLTLFKGFIVSTHSKLLGVPKNELPALYFKYLAHYKIAIIMLNIVPYITLKLMYS
ncbi:DUF6868 family protein [Litorilituus lipolyticus]